MDEEKKLQKFFNSIFSRPIPITSLSLFLFLFFSLTLRVLLVEWNGMMKVVSLSCQGHFSLVVVHETTFHCSISHCTRYYFFISSSIMHSINSSHDSLCGMFYGGRNKFIAHSSFLFIIFFLLCNFSLSTS